MKISVVLLTSLLLSLSVFAQKSNGDSGDLDNQLLVFIPNAFTPNGDPINSVFKPVISGPELDLYELLIVARNGRQVFYSEDPTEPWTGDIEDGGYTMAPSVFVYYLKVKSVEDLAVQTYTGHVVMIR